VDGGINTAALPPLPDPDHSKHSRINSSIEKATKTIPNCRIPGIIQQRVKKILYLDTNQDNRNASIERRGQHQADSNSAGKQQTKRLTILV